MTFLWSHALWLLAGLPLLVAAYVGFNRRRRGGLRYANIAAARAATNLAGRWRRHVPSLLFLAAIGAAFIAVSRPVIVDDNAPRRTLVLAIDASGSMQAEDAAPSRLAAAQAAARKLVEAQPHDVRVGVVAFGYHADLMQEPTSDHSQALAAIDDIELHYGSGIGTGLMAALIVLFPKANIGAPYDVFAFRAPVGYFDAPGVALRPQQVQRPTGKQRAQGTASIVLLTDGSANGGVPAELAARIAADRGVSVHTVGVGTEAGGFVDFVWGRQAVGYDAAALKGIARATGGRFFAIDSAQAQARVMRGLEAHAAFPLRDREVSALFSALAAVLLVASAFLSLLWYRRMEPGPHPGSTLSLSRQRAVLPDMPGIG